MDWIETVIIAIVEGLTEFLPVSSTGHMIITQNLLGIEQGDPFVHAFTFIIQFGAILSVVCLYWKRFFQFDNTPAPAGSSLFQREDGTKLDDKGEGVHKGVALLDAQQVLGDNHVTCRRHGQKLRKSLYDGYNHCL